MNSEFNLIIIIIIIIIYDVLLILYVIYRVPLLLANDINCITSSISISEIKFVQTALKRNDPTIPAVVYSIFGLPPT